MDYLRGSKIEKKDGEWVFEDTGLKVSDTWESRPCGYCNKTNTKEGHDGCLGTLPGLMNACCGHGNIKECYIQFLDGTTIHGEDAFKIQEILKKQVIK